MESSRIKSLYNRIKKLDIKTSRTPSYHSSSSSCSSFHHHHHHLHPPLPPLPPLPLFSIKSLDNTNQIIDQYLNIKLNNTTVNQNESFIHLGSLKNCFIRGSVVRYVFFPPSEVDIELLQKACRKELRSMNDFKEKQK
ncbi:U6 snRNA-associated Sm-like protein LSm2 [Cryptosporidium meleagridis]